ncbi:unnamed protein product, partial [Ectocarpus sp. 12 AP-2014]
PDPGSTSPTETIFLTRQEDRKECMKYLQATKETASTSAICCKTSEGPERYLSFGGTAPASAKCLTLSGSCGLLYFDNSPDSRRRRGIFSLADSHQRKSQRGSLLKNIDMSKLLPAGTAFFLPQDKN